MKHHTYVYHFPDEIDLLKVEATLVAALWSAEALYGQARVQLDARHLLDEQQRTLSVDAGTVVGRDLCRLLTGYLQRELGGHRFRIERSAAPFAANPPAPAKVG